MTGLSTYTRLALLGVGIAISSTLAACGGRTIGPLDVAADDDESSLYGNYLAGRYAGSTRDMGAAAEFYERALEVDSENKSILERAFLLQLADGRFEKAIDLGKRMVGNDERNRLARLFLGLDAFKRGDFAAARVELDQARSGPINTLLRNLVMAWSYAAEGEIDRALAGLDESGLDSNAPTVYVLHRAYIQDFAERNDAAAADYAKAMQLTEGQSVDVVIAFGSLLERMGRTEDASRLYQDYVTATGDERWVRPEIDRLRSGSAAQRYVQSPHQGVARAIFDPATYLVRERAIDLPIIYLRLALFMDPEYTDARLLLAEIFEINQRFEEAVRVYRDVPRDSPLYSSIQIQIAIDLDRLDRTDEAVELLRSVVREGEESYDALITLGDILRMRDRFSESVDIYSQAIASVGRPTEDNWALYYSRGVSLERTGHWDEAERDFLAALDLSPNQPLALNYLGYSWIDQGVNYRRAMELIQQAADLSPDDGFIIDSLGWGHYKLGNYEEAVRHLERAIELQPEDPTINDHLGDAYWHVGRRLEARFQWRLALAMEPEERFIPEIERKLTEGLDPLPGREADVTPMDAAR